MTARRILKSIVFLAFIALGVCQNEPYYGQFLGKFLTLSHNVKGDVFAVDSRTLFIKGFSYNGHSHDAVFWAGTSEFPDRDGVHIPNDKSHFGSLPPSVNDNFILHLPGRFDIEDMRWLAVWNRDHAKSMGSLIFMTPIRPPQPMSIGHLVNTKHGISTGDILILDTQTILVSSFNYDGSGKEANWLLSKGTKPNGDGVLLLDRGSISRVVESKNSNFKLTLPDAHYIEDYDILSIWSKSEGEHYGFVDVPKTLFVPPSSRVFQFQEPKMEKFNCEMLNDNLGLEVRWLIEGDDIIIHLVGNIARNEYMALGLSKDDTFSKFDAADAVVTGIDMDGTGFAIDHYFQGDEKCMNGRGMCLDSVFGSENNLHLLKAQRVNIEGRGNFTIVKFKRPLRADDEINDQAIYTDGPQAILWAVGPLDPDGFVGSPTSQSRGNLLLDFGREPLWNCPPPTKVIDSPHETALSRSDHPHETSPSISDYPRETSSSISDDPPEASDKKHIGRIHCPGDHLFRAQLGPSPGDNSKTVWFINGLPTPELRIQRGITYTFIIEGGLNSPHHHPFYITNSQRGGLYKNILEANDEVEITYAGIQKDLVTGTIFPTAEGRLCVWSGTDFQFSMVESSREARQALKLHCEPGQPGKLIWTPTSETPDEVYYQSFSERNLGGKILVVDFCEETLPHRYLEIVTTKGGRPKVNMPSKNDDVERERDSSEIQFGEHTAKESFRIDENSKKAEYIATDADPDVLRERYSLTDDQRKTYNNVISSSGTSSDKLTERVDVIENRQAFENETVPSTLQKTETTDKVFPHDESERSDKFASNPENSRKLTAQNHAVLNSHRNSEDLTIKYPTHSTSETSAISAFGKPLPQVFKPQFEGGFIPLVTNPMKEKESTQPKEFIIAPHQQNRPHRPFLYNESVPFHGTFKPGIPDFSGFNISNYSQEDASIIMAPSSQDNLAFLAASKSKTIPRNFPPISSMPLRLLDRPSEILPRPQRVQAFGPRFQSPQQQPSLVEVRKTAFPHLVLNSRPNFPIPNTRGEDLSGLPSQRFYVSMQASSDKKVGPSSIPNLPTESSHNRKVQNPLQNKMIYPPQIQRRPDFYEEKEANLRQPNIPPRKFNAPQLFPNNNNKESNQQNAKLTLIRSGMLQPQANNRPKILNTNIPISNFQGSAERPIIPQGALRHPQPFINVPQPERTHHRNLFLRTVQIRSNPIHIEKTKINEGFFNHPQTTSKTLTLPNHRLNHNEKLVESFNGPEIQVSNASNEQRIYTNQEISEAEALNKNIPTLARDKPSVNQGMIPQKLPFNETLGAFLLSSNLESPQSPSGVNFQENRPIENNSNLSNLNNKSVNNKEYMRSKLNTDNNPIKSEVLIRATQNPENNRAQIVKVKTDQDSFNSRPATFLEPEREKYVLEVDDFSSSKDSKEDPAPFFEYEDEDHPDKSDSLITGTEYLHYDVPFGARLKFPQNGSKIPVKLLNETPKVSSPITRRPQTYPVNNSNRNSDDFINSVTSTPSTTPTTRSATAIPSTISTATDTILVAMESASNNVFNEKQAVSPKTEEKVKNLYYQPPFPTFHVNYETVNSSIQDAKPSNEMKHIPIVADSLESVMQAGYTGRKNILNNNANLSLDSPVVPPKVSENINLPQISDNPPTRDNRTDYSILNHVLALIGGPPDQ